MANGYMGKILRIDLAQGKIEEENLRQERAPKFIGGAGLAAKIIWDETTIETDPFSI